MTALSEDGRTRELLWADVGEKLNLSVREMRSLRTAFADVLGFGMSKGVSESLVPAIEFVARRRKEGADDDQIRQELMSAKSDRSWPEEVLSRMGQAESQTAATDSVACLSAFPESAMEASPEEGTPMMNPPRARLLLIEGGARGDKREACPLAENGSGFEPETEVALRHENAESETAEKALKDVIADLRRELNTHFAAEREDILRLEQCVRKLAIEVRDMRYALMLGFTRRDRKKGHKGVSNLLLG